MFYERNSYIRLKYFYRAYFYKAIVYKALFVFKTVIVTFLESSATLASVTLRLDNVFANPA